MITLTLPLPHSVNRAWRGRRGGGMRNSPEANRFYNDALAEVLRARAAGEIPAEALRGPLALSCVVFMARAGGDADNRLKAAQDALVRGAVIEDDSLICRTAIERRVDAEDPRIEMELTHIAPEDPAFRALVAAMPRRAQAEALGRKARRKPRTGQPKGRRIGSSRGAR